jgi:hypothetical protein
VTRVLSHVRRYFDFERPGTPGEFATLRAIETFVAGGLCYFAWSWLLAVWSVGESPFALWWNARVGLFDGALIMAVNTGLVTLLIGRGYFRKQERFAYLLAIPLLHLQFEMRYWGGTGLHHSYLIGMGLLAFGLGFCLFEEKTARLRFTFGAIYLFVSLGYFLSAMSKLHNTGPDWVDGRNLQMWISMNQVHRVSKNQPFELNAVQELVMRHTFLASFILASGFVIEMSGFLMCTRRLRPYYTTAVLSMHFGILFVMKILFLWNIGLLLLVGYPWAALIDGRLRKRSLAPASAPLPQPAFDAGGLLQP